MPRFYLHICDASSSTEDDEGYEFADVDAARVEAVWAARELMAADLRNGDPLGLNRFFRVTNENGETLFTVQFRDAVPGE